MQLSPPCISWVFHFLNWHSVPITQQSSILLSHPTPPPTPVCSVAQSCLTLCNPTDYSLPDFFCPWDSPGKNTAVGCHSLLQGIFLTQELNSAFSALAGRFFTTREGLPLLILNSPALASFLWIQMREEYEWQKVVLNMQKLLGREHVLELWRILAQGGQKVLLRVPTPMCE